MNKIKEKQEEYEIKCPECGDETSEVELETYGEMCMTCYEETGKQLNQD